MAFITRQSTLMVLFLLLLKSASSQQNEISGWLFVSHSQQLNTKWSYLTDVQLRSNSKFKHLQNILLRPALLYQLSEKHIVGLGYTYFASRDFSKAPTAFEPENRIFEQYELRLKTGRLTLNNRLRLEQRFINKMGKEMFAQRLRHQVQAKFRLTADTAFEHGFYLNLQNEIFLNVQNKKYINDNFFDQNRPYAGVGFRFSQKFEAETGYYYRYQLEELKKREHIFQLMLLTNL